MFLSEDKPLLALKRWFESRIPDMPRSIELLRRAKEEIDGNPRLKADVDVVDVTEVGSDWVLRDFDPDSIPLRDALGDPSVAAVRSRVLNELEGTRTSILGNILGKLRRTPPSANLHWSPTKQKILIIDMQ